MLPSRLSRVASLTMSSRNTSSKNSKNNLNIYWFRHQDLRLHDNPALQQCITDSTKNSIGIVPIFCFDPRFVGKTTTTPFGSLKCSVKRAQFILESVQNLRENLEKQGSGLVVALGNSDVIIDQLCSSITSTTANDMQPNIYCQQEIASEELAINKNMKNILRKYKGSLQSKWGSALYDIDDLNDVFNGGVYGIPDTFTPFRNKVSKKSCID